MKKNLLLFLQLFFSLFFASQQTKASFFNPSPYQENFGNAAYATSWNTAGTYLAVGGANFTQDLTIYSHDKTYLTPIANQLFGSGAYTVAWTPNDQYIAVGGLNGNNPLCIYNWDGIDLTLTTSKYFGTQANAVAWNPAGNTLAVGGAWGNNSLALYNWDGSSTLTLTGSQYFGTQVNALTWHPSGNKLAVAGNYSTNALALYNWNGSALSLTSSKYFGTQAYALAWTHTGTWLAVGGDYLTNNVAIYTLSGSTLTLTTSISFGTQANTLSWSFDDRYLTVGGNNSDADLIVYEWDGTTLNKIYNSQTSYGSGVYGASWSPYSNYLAVAGDNNSRDLTIYTNHGYLNGTKNNVAISDHYLFTHGGYAFGNVNISSGCTVSPAQTLKLDLLTPLSGGLDLRNTGILELEEDLYLDSNVTLSTGGYISGQSHALYLGNNLNIPDNSIIHITSNTIIDGNGHNLILGHASQLFIDSNVTLTLKNLTLQNTLNTQTLPPIALQDNTSKLALDNVELAPTNNFYFTTGQLFIHNDVAFTGTSKFMYRSPGQSYITKNATLYFDHDTTLDYSPTSTNKNLLALEDASSCLYLNGSTLHVTHTGLQLTKGQLYLDNNVTFSSEHVEIEILQDPIFTYSRQYGNPVYSASWSPNGTYLAVGGITSTDGNDLQIYDFNETLLTKIASANFALGSLNCIKWRPDGNFLAIGGYNHTGGNEIQIYSFDGTTLTSITGADYGNIIYYSQVRSVSWNSTGNYLAVSGYKPTDGNQIQIFSFDGTNLVKITGANIGDSGSIADQIQWNTNNNTLATVTYESTTETTLRFFNFDGTNLTQITSITYGLDSNYYALAWSPNGDFIADSIWFPSGTQIKIYSFNGTTATEITSTNVEYLYSMAWSPDGQTLAAGVPNTSDGNVQFFDFNGTSLTPRTGSGFIFGTNINSMEYSPNGTYLALGKHDVSPASGYVGVYQVNRAPSYQSASNSIIFGNAALGQNYDLDVKVLSGANVNINSMVNYDCAV